MKLCDFATSFGTKRARRAPSQQDIEHSRYPPINFQHQSAHNRVQKVNLTHLNHFPPKQHRMTNRMRMHLMVSIAISMTSVPEHQPHDPVPPAREQSKTSDERWKFHWFGRVESLDRFESEHETERDEDHSYARAQDRERSGRCSIDGRVESEGLTVDQICDECDSRETIRETGIVFTVLSLQSTDLEERKITTSVELRRRIGNQAQNSLRRRRVEQ